MVRQRQNRLSWIVAIPLACCIVGNSYGFPGDWVATLDRAVEIAGKENKDILLLFTGLDWEPASKELNDEVFSKEAFARELEKDFVLVHVDIPEQPKQEDEASASELKQYELVRKFFVSRVPVYYLCTSDGRPYKASGCESGGVEANLLKIRSLKKEYDDTMANIEQAGGPERAKLLDEWLQTIPGPVQDMFADVKEQIVDLDPENTTGLWYKYKLQLMRPKATEARLQARLEVAETLFLQMVEELNLQGEELQDVLYELGDVYYQQRDFPKLLECIQRAKEAAPHSNRMATLNEMEEVFTKQWEELKRQVRNAPETKVTSGTVAVAEDTTFNGTARNSSTERQQPGLRRPSPPAIEEPKMVFVTGGTFKNTKSNFHEKEVTIASFYIGKYEVTQREWIEVMGSNPSQFRGDDRPVEMVSWYDCIEYCNRRSIQEGLSPYYHIDKDQKDPNNLTDIDDIKWTVTIIPRADGYRLPTEVEWEYAAGGGARSSSYTYSGGDDVDKVAWYWQNSGDEYLTGAWNWARLERNNNQSKAVGSQEPNELGLYDMSGNVREWCWDWYAACACNPEESTSDTGRVWRGGGWMGGDYCCASSFRGNFEASGRGPDQGLRVCRGE